jgi:DNA-binding IclR family transcriptional regulator
MQVLEALAATRAPVSLATLSAQLVLPKTSLMHLLRALEAASYIRRADKGFKLASASFRLASAVGRSLAFEDVVADTLQRLRDTTQETALLGTFTADRRCAVYTERRTSNQPVRFDPDVGQERPLYSSGVGTLLLAFSDAGYREEYLKTVKLVRQARRTVRTKAALRAKLDQVRKDGVSISIDEMADGGSAVAAPVFDTEGRIRAALVLAVPTGRFIVHRKRLETLVRQGANELSSIASSR